MKKIISVFAIGSFLFANNYNDFQQQFNNYIKTTNTQYINYKKELNNGFKQYKEALNKGFELYKKSLSKYWKNPELSDKTTFVEYSKDKKIRKKVDYKNNYIQIDVIAKDAVSAKKEIAKSLYSLSVENTQTAFNKNPVLKTVNTQLKNKYVSMVKSTPPSKEPIVADIIFKKPPTQKEVIHYALKTVKTHKINTTSSKVPDMKVYSIKIPLPPKSYLRKAKIYKSEVFKRSKQFKLTPEFIYAIIQTESAFNPMARSYIPAFGLMQIVPSSAGADAYKMLTGQKKILAPSYLYNAQNNILIGSAYLNKIYYGYMRKIKNPMSRLYCTIAA
jgi:membrane-bound lytic murein transglycosylase C